MATNYRAIDVLDNEAAETCTYDLASSHGEDAMLYGRKTVSSPPPDPVGRWVGVHESRPMLTVSTLRHRSDGTCVQHLLRTDLRLRNPPRKDTAGGVRSTGGHFSSFCLKWQRFGFSGLPIFDRSRTTSSIVGQQHRDCGKMVWGRRGQFCPHLRDELVRPQFEAASIRLARRPPWCPLLASKLLQEIVIKFKGPREASRKPRGAEYRLDKNWNAGYRINVVCHRTCSSGCL